MASGRRTILIMGLPYFGRMLTEVLSSPEWEVSHLPPSPLFSPASVRAGLQAARSDVVYSIGGRVQRYGKAFWMQLLCRQRPVRTKFVMHWVGSDVLHARRSYEQGRASRLLIDGPTHLAETTWLVEELTSIGVRAQVMPLASTKMPEEIPPLPSEFVVLTYLLPGKEAFYGSDAIAALARNLPQARFVVVGGGQPDEALADLPNVRLLGWVEDMSSLYRGVTVLLRLPRHDGLSFMVLECLARGRHVVWRYPIEGGLRAENMEEAREHLKSLWERHQRGTLGLNEEGITAVNQKYHSTVIRTNHLSLFDALLEEGP